jgi:S-adenosylmethionine synthetase
MNLSITHRSPYAPPVEFVERKGVGHPDTICDRLAEDLARRLAAEYLEHTGMVQPFNVDKAVLAAGSVDVGFGWMPSTEDLADEFKLRLLELLPDATPEAFDVEVWLNQSSVDLATVVKSRKADAPLSNDTSFAAVSLPRSPLEEMVYRVEKRLNADDYRAVVPVGRDIKVMGARTDSSVRLTVASPVMADKVANRAQYDEVVTEVRDSVSRIATDIYGDMVDVAVNQADEVDSAYLTITGTSAEAGDDGQVGRGNRFGGLITPYRPMSLEAAAGKNPAAHVGKTYHAVGADISDRLLAESDISETTIRLLSSIGHPVTEPQAVHVDVVGPHDEAHIAGIVKECFADWQGVRDRLISGSYELF